MSRRWLILALTALWVVAGLAFALYFVIHGDQFAAVWFIGVALIWPTAPFYLRRRFYRMPEGFDLEARRLAIIASGPELFAGYCKLALSWIQLYGWPAPWVSVRPGGILFEPIWSRLHAIPTSEIRGVRPMPGVPTRWMRVDHLGIDSRSPLVLMSDPGSPLGLALASLAIGDDRAYLLIVKPPIPPSTIEPKVARLSCPPTRLARLSPTLSVDEGSDSAGRGSVLAGGWVGLRPARPTGSTSREQPRLARSQPRARPLARPPQGAGKPRQLVTMAR